jgi:transcriptional regulator GlxA family with amidase domain
LDVLEAMLAVRLPRVRGVHPAVAMALERLQTDVAVGAVVDESGYSHRRFSSLFAQSVGLTPKRYSRVRRFQRTVAAMAADPSARLVDLAVAGGYADQAHFTRDFVDFAGVTPGEYRSLSPADPMHVPVADDRR